MKCGLIEPFPGILVDELTCESYVWYEKDWKHDPYYHVHRRAQLTFVEKGYQYIHTDQKIYLVPRNHAIWIPAHHRHMTTSEAESVDLMVLLFLPVFQHKFFDTVQVFAVPSVLREMLLYSAKWNRVTEQDMEQQSMMKAILQNLPGFGMESNPLQIPVPADPALIPVCDYLHAHFAKEFTLDALAEVASMSVRTLQRKFRQQTGITMQKYLQLIRILKSVELLDQKQFTLTQIAHKVGYQSLSAFSASYKEIMKKKPVSVFKPTIVITAI